MIKSVIAIFIVIIVCVIAVTAGCVKAFSKNEDLRLWEEECKRRRVDGK